MAGHGIVKPSHAHILSSIIPSRWTSIIDWSERNINMSGYHGSKNSSSYLYPPNVENVEDGEIAEIPLNVPTDKKSEFFQAPLPPSSSSSSSLIEQQSKRSSSSNLSVDQSNSVSSYSSRSSYGHTDFSANSSNAIIDSKVKVSSIISTSSFHDANVFSCRFPVSLASTGGTVVAEQGKSTGYNNFHNLSSFNSNTTAPPPNNVSATFQYSTTSSPHKVLPHTQHNPSDKYMGGSASRQPPPPPRLPPYPANVSGGDLGSNSTFSISSNSKVYDQNINNFSSAGGSHFDAYDVSSRFVDRDQYRGGNRTVERSVEVSSLQPPLWHNVSAPPLPRPFVPPSSVTHNASLPFLSAASLRQVPAASSLHPSLSSLEAPPPPPPPPSIETLPHLSITLSTSGAATLLPPPVVNEIHSQVTSSGLKPKSLITVVSKANLSLKEDKFPTTSVANVNLNPLTSSTLSVQVASLPSVVSTHTIRTRPPSKSRSSSIGSCSANVNLDNSQNDFVGNNVRSGSIDGAPDMLVVAGGGRSYDATRLTVPNVDTVENTAANKSVHEVAVCDDSKIATQTAKCNTTIVGQDDHVVVSDVKQPIEHSLSSSIPYHDGAEVLVHPVKGVVSTSERQTVSGGSNRPIIDTSMCPPSFSETPSSSSGSTTSSSSLKRPRLAWGQGLRLVTPTHVSATAVVPLMERSVSHGAQDLLPSSNEVSDLGPEMRRCQSEILTSSQKKFLPDALTTILSPRVTGLRGEESDISSVDSSSPRSNTNGTPRLKIKNSLDALTDASTVVESITLRGSDVDVDGSESRIDELARTYGNGNVLDSPIMKHKENCEGQLDEAMKPCSTVMVLVNDLSVPMMVQCNNVSQADLTSGASSVKIKGKPGRPSLTDEEKAAKKAERKALKKRKSGESNGQETIPVNTDVDVVEDLLKVGDCGGNSPRSSVDGLLFQKKKRGRPAGRGNNEKMGERLEDQLSESCEESPGEKDSKVVGEHSKEKAEVKSEENVTVKPNKLLQRVGERSEENVGDKSTEIINEIKSLKKSSDVRSPEEHLTADNSSAPNPFNENQVEQKQLEQVKRQPIAQVQQQSVRSPVVKVKTPEYVFSEVVQNISGAHYGDVEKNSGGKRETTKSSNRPRKRVLSEDLTTIENTTEPEWAPAAITTRHHIDAFQQLQLQGNVDNSRIEHARTLRDDSLYGGIPRVRRSRSELCQSASIGEIFTTLSDIRNSYFAVQNVLRLQVGISGLSQEGLDSLNRKISNPYSVVTLPIPPSSEIATCLDIIELHSNRLNDTLLELYEHQLELQQRCFLTEQQNSKEFGVKQTSAFFTTSVEEIEGEGIEHVSSSSLGAVTNKIFNSTSNSFSGKTHSTLIPEIKSSRHRFNLKINIPAGSSVSAAADQLSTVHVSSPITILKKFRNTPLSAASIPSTPRVTVSSTKSLSSLEEYKSNLFLSSDTYTPFLLSNFATVRKANVIHFMAPVSAAVQDPRFTDHQVTFQRQDLERKRPTVLQEIRRRKIGKIQAWEALGDRYLDVHHYWKNYIDHCGPKEGEERYGDKQGPRLRAVSAITSSSYSMNSFSGVGGFGSGGLRSTHARYSSLRATSDIARNDFDHDSILQHQAMVELMKRRLEFGTADIPSMTTPWVQADATRLPEVPLWPPVGLNVPGYKYLQPTKESSLIAKNKEYSMSNVPSLQISVVSTPDDVVEIEASKNKPESKVEKISLGQTQVFKSTVRDIKADDVPKVKIHVKSKKASKLIPPTTLETVSKREENSFPKLIRGVPDILDLNGCRLSVDGRRQRCAQLPIGIACPPGCNCAKEVDKLERFSNVWSDIEKCIFVDKFMQFPKNFHKIASFLVNRTTRDCVQFYYDSKSTIPYKSLLREFDNRKKNVRNNWSQSCQAALSVGSVIFSPEDIDDKEPHFELPINETSFVAHASHPPFMAMAKGLETGDSYCAYRRAQEEKLGMRPPRERTDYLIARRHWKKNYDAQFSAEVEKMNKAKKNCIIIGDSIFQAKVPQKWTYLQDNDYSLYDSNSNQIWTSGKEETSHQLFHYKVGSQTLINKHPICTLPNASDTDSDNYLLNANISRKKKSKRENNDSYASVYGGYGLGDEYLKYAPLPSVPLKQVSQSNKVSASNIVWDDIYPLEYMGSHAQNDANHVGRSRYPINRVISQRMTSANINGRNANRSRGSGGVVSRSGGGEKKEKIVVDKGKYINVEEAGLYSDTKPKERVVFSTQKSRSRETHTENSAESASFINKYKVITNVSGAESNYSISLMPVGEVSVVPSEDQSFVEKEKEKSILDENAVHALPLELNSTAISTGFSEKDDDILQGETFNKETKVSIEINVARNDSEMCMDVSPLVVNEVKDTLTEEIKHETNSITDEVQELNTARKRKFSVNEVDEVLLKKERKDCSSAHDHNLDHSVAHLNDNNIDSVIASKESALDVKSPADFVSFATNENLLDDRVVEFHVEENYENRSEMCQLEDDGSEKKIAATFFGTETIYENGRAHEVDYDDATFQRNVSTTFVADNTYEDSPDNRQKADNDPLLAQATSTLCPVPFSIVTDDINADNN